MNASVRTVMRPERRADEPISAFLAFRIYCKMGYSRSLDEAWQTYCREKCERSGSDLGEDGPRWDSSG